MVQFRYEAVDGSGHLQEGVIEAESTVEAAKSLDASGLTVESLDRIDDPVSGGAGSNSEPRNVVSSGSNPWGASRGPTAAPGAPLEFSDGAEARAARFEPAGPEPPPPPREMPSGADAKGVFAFLFGGIFTGVALLFIIVGVVILLSGALFGLFFIFFPMIHLGIGLVALRSAVRSRNENQVLGEAGVATVAEVESIDRNRKVRINGRHPYLLEYRFVLDGLTHVGDYSTMNRAVTSHEPGDQIWILYEPDDPSNNIIWPPV